MNPDNGRISEMDVYLIKEGNHSRLWEVLGSHPCVVDDQNGTHFAVWAPNAESVSVIGDFNDWDGGTDPLMVRWDESGIWEGFVPGIGKGDLYKYLIRSKRGGGEFRKTDPMAFHNEMPPRTASKIWDLDHRWDDGAWMKNRTGSGTLREPMSVYEVHLGSWRRGADGGWLSYRDMARPLADHVDRAGFTHVEFLPVMEHPFYGSWGYQVTGYFAPTSRYGTPQDLMYLIDHLHRRGIGVILDWVPSHFPSDEHGLALFDGTHLYEHADKRRGFHPDWNSLIFNYGRREVKNFLISSARYWLEVYHADGLRVDAVASMLYLDYSRKEGEWLPNEHGGNENLEAICFLKRMNEVVYEACPGIHTTAEESTAWPKVSAPTHDGGLGFGMKWDMGWMHDTLDYFTKDPVHRKFHHDKLTFRMLYAHSENYVLPLSHDEVVHCKGSLLDRMPQDDWRKYANLRALLGYMYAQPGKKLLFMGAELGMKGDWDHDGELDWSLLSEPAGKGLFRWVSHLNRLYGRETALHELDANPDGFQWVDCRDSDASILSLLRRDSSFENEVLVVCNFTPTPRKGYRIGVPMDGFWKLLLNSDSRRYGGSGYPGVRGKWTSEKGFHDRPFSITLTLPPLGVLFLKLRVET